MAINVVYIMSLLYSLKQSGFEWSLWMVFWPCFYAYLESKTFSMIIREIGNGLKPELSLDLFGVITLSHVVSIFSDAYGTYVLYLVPLYGLYKIGSFAFSYLKGKSDAATTAEKSELDPQEAKKKAKKER